uniref:NADH-ubiquinone oxidoreductase chain 3 n=1 Tax=Paraspadella gotoi TaxID=34758 RepID=Q6E0W0_PARGO|nr:NADH dehydrogenase subunit 3 [Paraspadella gotoi]AAT12172.1 NADH dehydrogenase subunit 3 [Paraspadella gotoi]
MFLVMMYFCFSILICSFMYFLFFLNFKVDFNKEKISPFECGFDPLSDARLPFCMKFFVIGVIFLIFDIEVVLILPMPFTKILFFFLAVIMLGLIYEWFFGGLDWMV